MTIRRGQPWGAPGPLSPGAPVIDNDHELALSIQRARRVIGDPSNIPEFGLSGGDLHRTVGSPRRTRDELVIGEGTRLPIDIGLVEFELDGAVVEHLFVAHLVASADRFHRLWARRTVVVMNGSFLGAANLGPRAHPNDGRLDVTDGRLGPMDRRRASRRAVTGAHVPHPGLRESRITELEIDNGTPLQVTVDGVRIGSAERLSVRCIADGALIVV